jgi:hypothetical protein
MVRLLGRRRADKFAALIICVHFRKISREANPSPQTHCVRVTSNLALCISDDTERWLSSLAILTTSYSSTYIKA